MRNPTLARFECSAALRARRVDVLRGPASPISENETLFTLIGTTYGGDGQSTFALPDLSRPASRCIRATVSFSRKTGVRKKSR